MRVCKTCSEEKSLSEFHKNGDGWRTDCKQCAKTAQAIRRAKKDPTEHDYGRKDVPEGFRIKGVTQLLGSDGSIKSQHVKTEREPETKQDPKVAFTAMTAALCEPYRGSIKPRARTAEHVDEDLIAVIPIGDLHHGLITHAEEVGETWDYRNSEECLFDAVDGLLDAAPPARECLIGNVGDFLHSDNSKSQTSKGTPLDTQGPRFSVMLTCIRMLRRCIDRALENHELVTVITCTGNHDGESSLWLRLCLSLAYENEPRVVIRTEDHKIHYHRFGKCFFAWTHGDTGKLADVPLVMAVDRPHDWAETEHRKVFSGHIHHTTVKEMPGAVCQTYRSLSKGDKWHNWSQYRSDRDLVLELWHREYGHIQTFTHGIKRILARQSS